MKKVFLFLFILFLLVPQPVHAQQRRVPNVAPSETPLPTEEESPPATPSATIIPRPAQDVTRPEAQQEREELIGLFSLRPIEKLTPFNFMAYTVQYAVVKAGIPANTIILIMLLPLIASIVTFFRHIVGLPSLGLLVPITLSITLLATGVTAGLVLLFAILLASTIARILLKKVRIMQLPKIAMSLWFVSFFVFLTLLASANISILAVKQLSIFPVLMLIVLSERLVAIQLERNLREMVYITGATIGLGILGFLLLSSPSLRTIVLIYPETILLILPFDYIIGRYFGLRLTEYIRFSPILEHGSK